MATIVPRQGPELDQDERVGLLAAQPYDKIGVLGVFGQKPPKPLFCHMAAPRVNPPARPDLIPAPAAVL